MAYCSSYYLYQRYEKRGDQDWIPSYPNVYSIDGEGAKPLRARQMYDSDCGWIPDTEVQNRTLSGTPFCTGYDKYVNETYQVSYDSGVTWETTGNEDVLVERNSTDCGYIPPEPIYRWVQIAPTSDQSTYWCDDCPAPSYSGQYFTLEALENGSFQFSGSSCSTIDNSSIEYSLNSGSTWNTLTRGNSLSVASGQKVYFKSTTLSPIGFSIGTGGHGIGIFSSTGRFNAEGNIMSLFYGDNFDDKTSLSNKGCAFAQLFEGCTKLVNANNLCLPATTLSRYCYWYMFNGCSSLISVPELPATTLPSDAYAFMFARCTSLATVPNNMLPATIFENTEGQPSQYHGMFSGCTSLTNAPALPATTLTYMCYDGMFEYCSSLRTAPELPATILAEYCYDSMFNGCTSLTSTPSLPATALAQGCYRYMFSGCTSLTTATALPATALVDWCYTGMFQRCTSLTTAPALSAATLVRGCYYYMFDGCSSLNYVKCLATDISATTCTNYWLRNVSNSGTFIKNCDNNSWTRDYDGIPSNWSVNCEGSNPANQYLTLEAIDSTAFSYLKVSGGTILYSLDNGATWTENYSTYNDHQHITKTPVIPAGSKVMFKGVGGADNNILPITSSGDNNNSARFKVYGNVMSMVYGDNFIGKTDLSGMCFSHTFSLCRGLTTAENLVLPALNLSERRQDSDAYGCYAMMFYGCLSLAAAPKLPATGLTRGCYNEMFSGCTSLTTAPELPATTLTDHCYNAMFSGCASLKFIKCFATDISAYGCTGSWVQGVSSSGWFDKVRETSWPSGINGIPSGWLISYV